MSAHYRKHNDRTRNSSTYHKKDGTNIRAILKREPLEFSRCNKCYRIGSIAEVGNQCLRGYQNPVGHETPRCTGIMQPNRPTRP
jgi:hypothetical protein